MPKILELNQESLKIEKHGFITSGNLLLGCIVYTDILEPSITWHNEVVDKFAEYKNQIDEFIDRITGGDKAIILAGSLQLPKKGNELIGAFYETMNQKGCRYVPTLYTEDPEKYYIDTPKGDVLPKANVKDNGRFL